MEGLGVRSCYFHRCRLELPCHVDLGVAASPHTSPRRDTKSLTPLALYDILSGIGPTRDGDAHIHSKLGSIRHAIT